MQGYGQYVPGGPHAGGPRIDDAARRSYTVRTKTGTDRPGGPGDMTRRRRCRATA